MVKKIVFVLLMVVVFLWSIRIIKINQNPHSAIPCYAMNEEINLNRISVKAVAAEYTSGKEYVKKYDVEKDELYEEIEKEKVVSVCIEVKNQSDSSIEWDEIGDLTVYGFLTRTWSSQNMVQLVKKRNHFSEKKLLPGKTQDIWFATVVSSVSFKKTTWKKLNVSDFYYALPTENESIRIRLE